MVWTGELAQASGQRLELVDEQQANQLEEKSGSLLSALSQALASIGTSLRAPH